MCNLQTRLPRRFYTYGRYGLVTSSYISINQASHTTGDRSASLVHLHCHFQSSYTSAARFKHTTVLTPSPTPTLTWGLSLIQALSINQAPHTTGVPCKSLLHICRAIQHVCSASKMHHTHTHTHTHMA